MLACNTTRQVRAPKHVRFHSIATLLPSLAHRHGQQDSAGLLPGTTTQHTPNCRELKQAPTSHQSFSFPSGKHLLPGEPV